MKVKPYRACDICGKPFQRESGCMHITAKKMEDNWGLLRDYKWRSWDLCQKCQNDMYFYLRRHCREEIENER